MVKRKRRQQRGRSGRPPAKRRKLTVSGQPVAVHECCRLSRDVEKLCYTLENPSSTPARLCLPDNPARLTQQFSSFVKGQLTTSSNKDGMIAVKPYQMVTNDLNGVIVSDLTTWAGNTITKTLPTTGLGGRLANAPYANADFGTASNKLMYRPVLTILKLRYVGTKLNEGGQIYMLSATGGGAKDLDGASGTIITQSQGYSESKLNTSWSYSAWVNTDDPQFQSSPSAGSPMSDVKLGALIYSAAASQLVEYEVRTWFEVSGTNLPSYAPSPADPVGWAAFSNAVAVAGLRRAAKNQFSGMRTLTAKTASAATTTFQDTAPVGQNTPQRHEIKSAGGLSNVIREVSSTMQPIVSAASSVVKGIMDSGVPQLAAAAAPLLLTL